VLVAAVTPNGAVAYSTVVLGWNLSAPGSCRHSSIRSLNLAFFKVGRFRESALGFESARLGPRMKFRVCSLDAAHRGCDLFGFEFLHSSMTAVNGVLPVDGVNGSALSGVPFCSQA